MASTFTDELKDNYRQAAAERGKSLAEFADDLERANPAATDVVEWLRSEKPPAKRSAPPKSEA